MGNDGGLKRSSTEYKRFVYHSDIVRLAGKIVKKYIDGNGEPCINIETHAINQPQEDVMPGTATVVPPSTEIKYWPLNRRLEFI